MFTVSNLATSLSVLLVLTGASVACSSHTPKPPGATPAVPAAGALPPGPPAPVGGLSVPDLAVPWQPPSLTAGDIEGLREAMGAHERALVLLGPRLAGARLAAPLVALPSWLHPPLEVVDIAEVPLTELLEGQHELPVERRANAGGGTEDDPRAPQYRWEQLVVAGETSALRADWSAAAIVAIDDAEVDLQAWRSLPAHSVGSCRAPVQALALAQERSVIMLERFLDHVDAQLSAVYRAQLRAFLPAVAEELAAYRLRPERSAFDNEQAQRRYVCGHAAWSYVQGFSPCKAVEGSCPVAPRIFLMGGARLGWVEPNVAVDEDCPVVLGRDYVGELRALADEAARVVARGLDPHWSALAARFGAMSEVDAMLNDVCEPRRRRFSQPDLVAFRDRLGRIGDALRSAEPPRAQARWVAKDESFHVAGVGPVRELARFDGGPTSPSEWVVRQAQALRKMVEDRARCAGDRESLPLAVVVLSPHPRRVEFLGYFFPEELMCADLPPLVDQTGDAPRVPVRAAG